MQVNGKKLLLNEESLLEKIHKVQFCLYSAKSQAQLTSVLLRGAHIQGGKSRLTVVSTQKFIILTIINLLLPTSVLVNSQVLKLHIINLFNKKNHFEDIIKITVTILASQKLSHFISHLNYVLYKLNINIVIPWAYINQQQIIYK